MHLSFVKSFHFVHVFIAFGHLSSLLSVNLSRKWLFVARNTALIWPLVVRGTKKVSRLSWKQSIPNLKASRLFNLSPAIDSQPRQQDLLPWLWKEEPTEEVPGAFCRNYEIMDVKLYTGSLNCSLCGAFSQLYWTGVPHNFILDTHNGLLSTLIRTIFRILRTGFSELVILTIRGIICWTRINDYSWFVTLHEFYICLGKPSCRGKSEKIYFWMYLSNSAQFLPCFNHSQPVLLRSNKVE